MKGNKLSSDAVEKWMSQASFVFYGRVEALGHSNLEGVEPEERMATVQIEEVVIAPRNLGDLVGKTITIYLQSTQGIRAGQRMMFFATSWHYGKNIGVVEIGQTSADSLAVRQNVRQTVMDERLRQLDEAILERIRGALLIISGRVLNTYRSERRDLPGIEDGAEWWEAEMWVRTVEKGRPHADQRIFFPIGGEVDWTQYPKCYPGQEGIWFLRPVEEIEEGGKGPRRHAKRRKKEKEGPEPEEPLMAQDQADFHALSALQRIQSLIWRAAAEQQP